MKLNLNITVHAAIAALGWIVTQAVAFGILDTGKAQVIVAIGGIVIPAAYVVAQALHLGRVHSALAMRGDSAVVPK